VKQVVDRVTAAGALAAFSPLLAAISIWILLDDGRPVLLRQQRAGKDGIPFGMFKFRSMVVDALERGRAMGLEDPYGVLKDDPRITRSGRFLRRSGLDELPQLLNVLRGEMSLVGPRPPVPHEVAQYDTAERRRLSMRPGLTCLWQVGGRNAVGFEEWVRLDLQYIDEWSLLGDLKILLRTIPTVLLGTGR
jgi:lipopolysaccharide/colanic/teichoic acid biosynthesis glycosyltransferase